MRDIQMLYAIGEADLFSFLFASKEPYVESEILNHGLRLAMAFGKHWMKPIQFRLIKKFPNLSKDDLDRYDLLCRQAMDSGHKAVIAQYERVGRDIDYDEFAQEIVSVYPWLTPRNVKYLFSQGMYYARKDLG